MYNRYFKRQDSENWSFHKLKLRCCDNNNTLFTPFFFTNIYNKTKQLKKKSKGTGNLK